MTNSEKLARWQGWKVQPRGKVTPPIPDYLNDDAAAMSLLDTLTSKGYVWFLGLDTDEIGKIADIRCKVRHKDSTASINKYADTRREAVVAACLELIGKEDL